MSFWSRKPADASEGVKDFSKAEQAAKDAAEVVDEGETSGIKEARYQIEGVTDMFNRMSDMCFNKCMGKMSDSDLNVGEMSCVDRCVLKYMQCQNNVGLKLREQTMLQQQQQEGGQPTA